MPEINIIDSSLFSIYLGYRLLDERLECKKIDNKYECENPQKGIERTFDEKMFSLLKDKIMREYIKESKIGDKYIIEIRKDKQEELNEIVNSIENACKPAYGEEKVCYITPDLGVYSRGDMVNPFVLAYKREIEQPEKNEWNNEIKHALFDLNAKILLDKDLKTVLGEEVYNRLVRFWSEFTGGRVYTDEEDKLKPVIVLESITDGVRDNIIISKDHMKISQREISKDLIEKHKALQKVQETLFNTAMYVNEHVEAKKRALLSRLEEGKAREYHGVEGKMDFYLKTITYNPDVKVYTIDKDIIKDITVKFSPNTENVVLVSRQ